MSLVENTILSLVRRNLSKKLDLKNVVDISSEGLREHRDIKYLNRSGKELLMDIFEPIVDEMTELPVILNYFMPFRFYDLIFLRAKEL
ncbi:MAG: hypothetical protein K6G64_00560 [Eubacterium sp.]|nr:hypothetical protein [Eubacterium sp.]